MDRETLLGVPNFSEGRDARALAAIGDALVRGRPPHEVRLLDVQSDPDHHRSVFTLAGPPGALADAMLRGAAMAVELVDVVARAGEEPAARGQHPHVGALDVAPVVYARPELRGAACAEALVLADRIGEQLEVPVLLYGELTAGLGLAGRTRAELRRGGIAGLGARLEDPADPLLPDFGPVHAHPRAGVTLIAARAPLVAFNLQLAPPAGIEDARAIAASIREGGEHGLPGVRAIGVLLGGGAAQVSMNVERPFELGLAEVLAAVRRLAPVASAEIVGLAPARALEGFPEDVPIFGFDPARQLLENALGW